MKIRGLLLGVVCLLFVVAISACQQQEPRQADSQVAKEVAVAKYEVTTPVGAVAQEAAVKMIDTVAVLEGNPDDMVEFVDGPWAVAVKNLKTGCTYYYDSGNNFLGRKIE